MDRFDKCCVKWTIFVSLLSCGVSQILCPSVSEFNSSVLLTCSISSPNVVIYRRLRDNGVVSCTAHPGVCISSKNNNRIKGTVVNTTYSIVEIRDVEKKDDGKWTCEEQNKAKTNCTLVLKTIDFGVFVHHDRNAWGTASTASTEHCYVKAWGKCRNVILKHNTAGDQRVYISKYATDGDNVRRLANSRRATPSWFHPTTLPRSASHQRTLCETPSCNINSDRNTTELVVTEEITLAVNITDYYCTVPIDFHLKTGDIVEELKRNHSVVEVTSDVFSSTMKVSDSHIGSLELLFSCYNVNTSVRCGGVKTLLKKLPSCNITSDTNTDELDAGQKLSLTAYIEEYRCSRNTEYQLQIGTITELKTNTTGSYNKTITFIVTESHFGPVYLNVTCNDISRIVLPGGIKKLQRRQPTTTHLVSSYTIGQPTTTHLVSSYTTGQPTTTHLVSSYTTGSLSDGAQYSFIGVGVGIGIVVMLLLDGVCILGIYLKRQQGSICKQDERLRLDRNDTLRSVEMEARPTQTMKALVLLGMMIQVLLKVFHMIYQGINVTDVREEMWMLELAMKTLVLLDMMMRTRLKMLSTICLKLSMIFFRKDMVRPVIQDLQYKRTRHSSMRTTVKKYLPSIAT